MTREGGRIHKNALLDLFAAETGAFFRQLSYLNKEVAGTMSRKRTSMRKIKEILRLSGKGLSPRQIAKIVKIGRTTVQDHLQRSFEAGINLEIAESISEEELGLCNLFSVI